MVGSCSSRDLVPRRQLVGSAILLRCGHVVTKRGGRISVYVLQGYHICASYMDERPDRGGPTSLDIIVGPTQLAAAGDAPINAVKCGCPS